jgi:hypothetical protein
MSDRMKNTALAPLAAALFVASIGCRNTTPVVIATPNTNAVWSDDGAEIAYAAHRDETRGTPRTGGGTTWRWTLHVRAPDGTGDRAALPERPAQIDEIFDMHRAGYVLFTEFDSSSGVYTTSIARGSNVVVVGASVSCSRGDGSAPIPIRPRFVPSPNGSLIARTLIPADCDAWKKDEKSLAVDLIDAATLATKSTSRIAYSGEQLQSTWLPDGSFVVGDGVKAWRVSVGSATPAVVAVPRCWAPQTTSSDTTKDGKKIAVNDDGTQAITAGAGFGCQ